MGGKYVAFLFTNTQFIKESETVECQIKLESKELLALTKQNSFIFLGALEKQVDVVPMGSYCPTFLNVFLV